MLAISLWQPWASWVAEGHKPIETRMHSRFKSLVGKRIAIHAAKKIDGQAQILAHKWITPVAAIDAVLSFDILGVIVCTAFVERAHWLDETHSAKAMIDCSNWNRFGLFLTDIKKLKNPIPYRGMQGIFKAHIDELLTKNKEE